MPRWQPSHRSIIANREMENVAARHQIRDSNLSGRRRRAFDIHPGPVQLHSESQSKAVTPIAEFNAGRTGEVARAYLDWQTKGATISGSGNQNGSLNRDAGMSGYGRGG